MKKKEVESKQEGSIKELNDSGPCNPSSSMVDIVVSMKQEDIFGTYLVVFYFLYE